MISFKTKNKYFFLGIVILMTVVFVNIFPRGYIFVGGDTLQLIEAKDSLNSFMYESQGRIGVFYSFFYLLDYLNVSDSAQLSFYLGVFLIGAYTSFYIFSKLIFRIKDQKTTLLSLFYSLNLFTLFVFTSNWGFSYYLSLYIYIPILVGLFTKYLKLEKGQYLACFALVLLLASSGFGNPAFALSSFLFFSLLVAGLLIFKYIDLNIDLIKKLGFVSLVSFLVSAFWIFPLLPQLKTGVDNLNNNNVLNLQDALRERATPIEKTISLNHRSEDYFPYKFYYKDQKQFKNLFIALSFLPIFLIVTGLFFYNKFDKKSKIFYFLFLFLLTLFILLVTRVRPPFEKINEFIYNIWGFNTMRHFEKTGIYIPFTMATLLLVISNQIKTKKIEKFLYAGMFLILLTPLPFYVGKLQQTAGYRVSTNRDYQTAKNSFLVKIPKQYYEIRETINNDRQKSFIAALPYSKNDGSGIVHYPKWNLYGVDITQYLYEKNSIGPTGEHFSGWKFAENFNEESGEWIIQLLGMMNSKYILYHKDATEKYVQATQGKIEQLEKDDLIENLKDNEYFTLYQIKKEFIIPYISLQKEKINIEGSIESVEKNSEKVRNSTEQIKFEQINPKKFVVHPENTNINSNIILAEKFNPLWKAYAIDKNGKEREIKTHFLARGYANGWELKGMEGAQKIIIEYYPIRLMWRGMIVSGTTVFFLLIYLIRYYYVKRFKKV